MQPPHDDDQDHQDPDQDNITAIKDAVQAMLENGRSLSTIMQILADCVGDHIDVPLEIDDMLALYGVYPRINERLEYIAAHGIATKLGIPPPTGFRAMEKSNVALRNALQRASDDCVAKVTFASQQRVLYAALKNVRRVYKPPQGKGVDLISVDFSVCEYTGLGTLVIHLYEMKDHKRMFLGGTNKAIVKLVTECARLRKLIEPTYASLVEGKILRETEFKCTLVVNGSVGNNVGAAYRFQEQRCMIIHGVEVHKLVFHNDEARRRYKKQIRRAAGDHA